MKGIRAWFFRVRERVRDYTSEHGFTCDGCGRELFDYPMRRLCEDCEKCLERNDGAVCDKCGRKAVTKGVCLGCKQHLPKFTQGITPFVYRGETAGLVNRIKNGTPLLAYYFAEQMADAFLKTHKTALDFSQEQDGLLVIPVPLTEKRRKHRGYNQAEFLAKAVCKALGRKGCKAETEDGILVKRRETPQQKHKNYHERMENVAGAYHVAKRKACRGRTVLLVDDILTTGATGSECAEKLISAGASEVVFLTAAAVPERK